MHKTWKRWVARLGVLASVPVVGMLALTGAANAAIDPSTSAAVTSGLDDTKTLIVIVGPATHGARDIQLEVTIDGPARKKLNGTGI